MRLLHANNASADGADGQQHHLLSGMPVPIDAGAATRRTRGVESALADNRWHGCSSRTDILIMPAYWTESCRSGPLPMFASHLKTIVDAGDRTCRSCPHPDTHRIVCFFDEAAGDITRRPRPRRRIDRHPRKRCLRKYSIR
jgi:hypothetical protein